MDSDLYFKCELLNGDNVKFDGKTYYSDKTFKLKSDATKYADKKRAQGYNARVRPISKTSMVYDKDRARWEVYTTSTRQKPRR